MDIEKFTERARGFIQSAQSLALREGNQQFTPDHLLKVLIDDEEGLAARLINAAGGRDAPVRAAVEAALKKLPKVQGGSGQVYLAQDTAKLLDNAETAAKKAGDKGTADQKAIVTANQAGDRATLKADSFIPLTMALIFLVLFIYFKSIGGYRALKIEEQA